MMRSSSTGTSLSLPLLSLLALALPKASAQTAGGSNVTCTYAFWEFNAVGDSPCTVWGQLQSLCTTNGLTVTPLLNASYQYSPPSLSGQANECNCNVVSYNLMAACSWCQPGILTSNWVTEAQWKQGCSSYDATGLPSITGLQGLTIPAWAYLPDNGASWNPETAEVAYNASTSSAASLSSASVASASAAGTTSSPAAAGTTSAAAGGGSSPAATGTAAAGGGGSGSTSGGGSKTNTGAIAGGVVGGVVGLALIAALIFFLVRRNRRASANAPLAASSNGGGQWSAGSGGYGTEAKAPVGGMGYNAPEVGYHGVPNPPGSPLPPGSTPSPYPYQAPTSTGPTSTYGASTGTAYGSGHGTAYDGSAPPTQYTASPPPGGYYQQPAYGEPYGQGGAMSTAGRYTGLPEAS